VGAGVRRDQTAHERLVPLLVELVGAESYLELGTYHNDTISRVHCPRRYGVDKLAIPLANATMFNMSTAEFVARVAPALAPFDFVFIDADHEEQAVREDFFGILPHVSAEGLIVMHDTNPETRTDATAGLCGTAWRFAEDLQVAGWEAVTLPYHPGLTIVRNRVHWGPK
jgi:methyltransferase family protein